MMETETKRQFGNELRVERTKAQDGKEKVRFFQTKEFNYSGLQIRTTSLDMKTGINGHSHSPNSSNVDLRISPLSDKTPSQSQSSLNSLSDKPNMQNLGGLGLR
jgi:hypothetical protein